MFNLRIAVGDFGAPREFDFLALCKALRRKSRARSQLHLVAERGINELGDDKDDVHEHVSMKRMD